MPTVAWAATTTYTVHSGDTLWNIANKYHTTVGVIENQNHLHSSLLQVGQKLLLDIPNTSSAHSSTVKSPSKASSSNSGKIVTVQAGNTLWGISQRYGVSLSNLEQWNGLTSYSTLHVGQKLKLYGVKAAALSGRSESVPVNFAAGVKGAEIAQYAERFVGVPYRWGGESASGFDCSGLVQFSFAHFGVYLSRTSYGQYQQGYGVSRWNLIPGDLVFFNADGPGASHVGIYIGGGRFVNSAGSHVQIDSLYDSYWSSHFIGAKRVL